MTNKQTANMLFDLHSKKLKFIIDSNGCESTVAHKLLCKKQCEQIINNSLA